MAHSNDGFSQTSQRTSVKALMVSIQWYLGCLKGKFGSDLLALYKGFGP